MCHRSGTIYHPTETRYIFVQILIFPTLSVSKPANARMFVTCLFLPWSPNLSVCLGYATFHEMVASKDKQREYETFILPALMNNNISVLTLLYVIFTYCTAALHHRHGSCSVCCEDLAAEERICFCCDIYFHICHQCAQIS